MKSFTERRPTVIGLVVVAVMSAIVGAVLLVNRSVFSPAYPLTARFADAAGVTPGTQVTVAGVVVGHVSSLHVDGNAVDMDLAINPGTVLPRRTDAAVTVETLLGVEDVTLEPVSGWAHPLAPGAVITTTSLPTTFADLEGTTGHLLAHADAHALNNLIESFAAISQGKERQVAQIIDGLGALTTAVDQRSGEVSQLIDAAGTVSDTLDDQGQQLTSVIDDLSTVTAGLADHSTDLAALIDNLDAMASQTNGLVGQDRPQLDALLANVHQILGVVAQHQDDLAETVGYLGAAVKGFASVGYSGPADTPTTWANIFTNPVTTAGAYGVIGPCGALDQALTAALGPDPLPCDEQTGPLPGTTPSDLAPGAPAPSAGSGGTTTTAGPGSTTTTPPADGLPVGPDSGLGGLSQLFGPLLGTKE